MTDGGLSTTTCQSAGTTTESTVKDITLSDKTDESDGRTLNFHNVSGKLYDRSKQQSRLLEAYRRCSSPPATNSDSKKEFILVSGPSGTGKTALVQALREPVRRDGGFFIAAKFDQLQRKEPFAELAHMFTELAHLAVLTGPAFVKSMKEAVEVEVEGEGRILTDMIPALVQILGEQQKVEALQGSDASRRFKRVMKKFIRALSSLDVPMLLFLDDLQWADSSSLDLLSRLVGDKEVERMIFVGTCRDDVPPDSALSCTLRHMEETNIRIVNIGVRNLKKEAVTQLLCDLLQLAPLLCQPLADVVYNMSNGNVFFVTEFLRFLISEGQLYFSDSHNRWHWESDAMHQTVSKGTDSNVALLVQNQITQLPPEHQEMFKVAAFIGASVDETILRVLLGPAAPKGLQFAVNKGFMLFDDQAQRYVFLHDTIQLASYSLVPERERDAFHLELGRKLWNGLSQDDLKTYIFVVLDQLTRGSRLVTDQHERYRISSLCLIAGEASMKSSAFETATEYFERGVSFLGPKTWKEQYDLTLALYNACAESQIVSGNSERMDAFTDGVFQNAHCFQDKLRAYVARIYSLGVRRELQQAIDTGFAVLRELGEPFPSKAPKHLVLLELTKTRRLLRGKTNEKLLRLPLIEARDKIASMQILNMLFLNVYLARPEFVSLVALRMVQLTLRSGMCSISSVAFAIYGIILCGLGEMEAGYRFGELALSILNKFKARHYIPRVYASFYGCVVHWTKPVHVVLDPLRYAHEIGMETGDIEFSLLNANLHTFFSTVCGKPLQEVEMELRKNYQLMVAHKQETLASVMLPGLQMTLNLQGQADDPIVLTGEFLNQDDAIQNAIDKKLPAMLQILFYHRMVLAYLFGDYSLADEMAQKCNNGEENVMASSYEITNVCFFRGLVALAAAQKCNKWARRRRNIRVAHRCTRMMKSWSRHCPWNFLHRLLFLEAEYSALVGNHDVAIAKYMSAIALFGEQGHVLSHALASERAGMFLLDHGDGDVAHMFLNQAYTSYQTWGAHAKANLLHEQIQTLK